MSASQTTGVAADAFVFERLLDSCGVCLLALILFILGCVVLAFALASSTLFDMILGLAACAFLWYWARIIAVYEVPRLRRLYAQAQET